MSSRTASVALDDHFWAFAERQVAEGHYGSTNEVIRAGLQRLEDDAQKLEALRAALIEGEESGPAEDFDMHEWFRKRFPDA